LQAFVVVLARIRYAKALRAGCCQNLLTTLPAMLRPPATLREAMRAGNSDAGGHMVSYSDKSEVSTVSP